MTTSFLVVRHGESTWNAERRWQGRADAPLSALGERQARSAASVVGSLGRFDVIVTSSLRRARRTGELIAKEAGMPLGDAVVDLAERSAGPWEGLTRTEIDDRFPGYLADGRRPEGYESDQSVVERALTAVTQLSATRPGQQLLVVTHGGVIGALERHLGDDDELPKLDNLEGRWFEHSNGALRTIGGRICLAESLPTTTGSAEAVTKLE